MQGKIGILGGMGPLASAEFLATLYRLNIVEPEQKAPSCVVLSDPTFPDRTEAILADSVEILAKRLEKALQALLDQGADRIVIACVTIHHVLPLVPEPLRLKVVSLIDLMLDEILSNPCPCLLLATTGTRVARIFESHERWNQIERWVSFPDDEDQRELHKLIYGLKSGLSGETCLSWIDTLAARYRVESFLFGCTELHLLHRFLATRPPSAKGIIDPLWTAARDLHLIFKI